MAVLCCESVSFTGVVLDATRSYTLAYVVTGVFQICGAVFQFVLIFLKPPGGSAQEEIRTTINGKSEPK